MKLIVYRPRPGSAAARVIALYSAILTVVPDQDAKHVVCYFEGNTIGAVNLDSFYARLMAASGRLITEAPTRARAQLLITDLIPIAEYDSQRLAITNVLDEDGLASWSGESLDQIIGTKLPPGPAAWGTAAQIVSEGRAVPGELESARAFWSRAGQLYLFSPTEGTVEVLSDSDPRLPLFLESDSPTPPLTM